jgi:hypothetical protein
MWVEEVNPSSLFPRASDKYPPKSITTSIEQKIAMLLAEK